MVDGAGTKFAFLHVKVCWCFDEGPRLRFPSKALNVDYRNSAADLDTRNMFSFTLPEVTVLVPALPGFVGLMSSNLLFTRCS